LGGESMDIESVAGEFYKDTNVQDVYMQRINGDLQVYLVLKEEIEDMALNLAMLQNDIQKNHKEQNLY
jgi:hypothetical protein